MGRRRVQTGTRLPKALACGMLEDGGRVLFLVRTDERGVERIEMPCVVVPSGRSPFADMKEAFPRLTGIDGQVHEIVMEGRYNAGSRRRRVMVPCLVFKVTAKSMRAKPAPEFSGFRWLSLEDAKGQRLAGTATWLHNARPAV
jgi:hypothetical protein